MTNYNEEVSKTNKTLGETNKFKRIVVEQLEWVKNNIEMNLTNEVLSKIRPLYSKQLD